jgi:hypothetical protein
MTSPPTCWSWHVLLWGGYAVKDLLRVARRVRDDLTEMSGISQANVLGASPPEISIEAHPMWLRDYGITLADHHTHRWRAGRFHFRKAGRRVRRCRGHLAQLRPAARCDPQPAPGTHMALHRLPLAPVVRLVFKTLPQG